MAIIAAQASLIGEALAKDPQFQRVRAQVLEIRRLKRAERMTRKRAPQAPASANVAGK